MKFEQAKCVPEVYCPQFQLKFNQEHVMIALSSSNFKILNALAGPEIFARLVRYVAKVNEIVIWQRPPIEHICYEMK